MSHRKPEVLRKLYVRDKRIRARGVNMVNANRLFACLLVIALSVLLPVAALPRLKSANENEEYLNTHWAAEVRKAVDAKDQASREYRAIEQDPRYLEY